MSKVTKVSIEDLNCKFKSAAGYHPNMVLIISLSDGTRHAFPTNWFINEITLFEDTIKEVSNNEV